MMDSTDLDRYIQARQLQAEIVRLPRHTPTVGAAAEALGVPPERIVKSLVFLLDRQPLLVIAGGSARVDRGRLAAWAGMGKKRVKLANAELAEALTGFGVGAMPPFGHRVRLRTVLDRRVLAQEEVWAGGGAIDTLLRLRPAVILAATGAEVVEVVAGDGA